MIFSVSSASLWLIFLLSNQFPHQPQHFPGLGMTMQLRFRIYKIPVNGHFELPAVRRDKRDRLDHVLIILKQLICQAHGPTGVVSDRAVNDLDSQHGPSEILQRLYH